MEMGAAFQRRGLGGSQTMRQAITFLSASINYLSIRRRNIRSFGGVNIQNEELWDTLPTLFAQMLRGVVPNLK